MLFQNGLFLLLDLAEAVIRIRHLVPLVPEQEHSKIIANDSRVFSRQFKRGFPQLANVPRLPNLVRFAAPNPSAPAIVVESFQRLP